jgi:YYY domain-containing protein
MTQALSWWFVVQVVGLVTFPLAYGFFRRLPDRGWAFSKPFGILFLTYLFWILNSAHILPNNQRGIAWALSLLALPAAWVVYSHREELWRLLRERWQYVLGVEVLFTLVFAVGGYLRSFMPEIAGTEKPMDFAFMNAISRADNFPPADPWLSGYSISYYYFGHLMTVTLGKLSDVPTSFAFNLGLMTVAALAAVAAFGLVYNLVAMRRAGPPDKRANATDKEANGHAGKGNPAPASRTHLKATARAAVEEKAPAATAIRVLLRSPVLYGVAAAALVILFANLEGVLEMLAAHGIGGSGFYNWVGIENLTAGKTTSQWYPTEHWFWWRATRIVPNTITEFPFFSFLLGDMHPHVMSIPFVLMMVGAALLLLRHDGRLDAAFWVRQPLMLVATGVMLGGLLFLNTWDMPTFAFLVVAFGFLRNRLALGGWDWRPLLAATLGFALPLLVVAVAAYIPFYGNFSSQAAGFEPVMDTATRPLHAVLIWGPLAVLLLPFVWQRLAAPGGPAIRRQHVQLALVPGLLVLLVWGFWVLALEGAGGLREQIADRRGGWFTAAALIVLLAALLLALWREIESKRSDEDSGPAVAFALGLGAVAVLLVLGAEFFYVRDVFGSRLNTVFKLYYQAWLLLAVVGGFALYRLASSSWGEGWGPRPWRVSWAGGAALVLAAALVYPVAATFNRTNNFDAPQTLDGLAFARSGQDLGAIDWLRGHVDGTAVVAEAPSGSYGPGGRVSAWTGLTTPMGWPGHEDQWRCKAGSACPILDDRYDDLERLYRTTDEEEARTVLDKYGVDFVFVGSLERESYPQEGLAKFDQMLPVAYQDGGATVYRAASALALSEGGP